ncbi:FAD-dependent urate hydroxylase [Melia azedarach]|uniref:FAD-dependent urate hydroxylase n=1 Tax=Melia azedarach TaxID=155640 RepID=A0ACC1XVS5_MELAZ|nr:FAD-dependent urate hydroxylase [Melia azedarach]
MTTILEEDVVIVGAGIAGLATAVALKRLGIRALVLEKADAPRATGAAITLFPNAWLALDALGVSHKLTSIYGRTKRRLVTNIRTGATRETSFVNTDGIESGPRSVHRRTLLEALADELPIDTIHFSAKVAAIETETFEGSSIAVIHLGDGTIIKAKILIGCDGIHSTVARWLGLSAPVDSGRSAVRGLAMFPEGHGLNKEARQFVDAGLRAGFAPLNDKEIYWFLSCTSPLKENTSANPELIQKELLENYAEIMPPLYLDVVRHCDLSTLTRAPLMFRYPWDITFGNLSKGNITVAGDAMHPMTPDLAQGGCSALEDAVVLGRHIGNSLIKHKTLVSGGIVEAIDGYVKERRWRITWLVAGSYLSGWVQQGGSKWWMKFLREVVYYRLLFSRIVNTVRYDCGKLPRVTFPGELDNSSKID